MPTQINPYRLFTGLFVPDWLATRPEISAGAKLCYGALVKNTSRHNALAWPSLETLAEELGLRSENSERQVRRYVRELQGYRKDVLHSELVLIEVTRHGLRKTNRYRFLWHPWMGIPEPERTDESDPIHRPDESSGQDRTHMSGQGRTVMSGQDQTDMSGHTISDRKRSNETDPREETPPAVTGHGSRSVNDPSTPAVLELSEELRATVPGLYRKLVSDLNIQAPPAEWVERWLLRGVTPGDIEHAIDVTRERADRPSTRYMDPILETIAAARKLGDEPRYLKSRGHGGIDAPVIGSDASSGPDPFAAVVRRSSDDVAEARRQRGDDP